MRPRRRPVATLSSTSGPKSADTDGDYVVKVKVGKGRPTTVVRLIEDGSVIGRVLPRGRQRPDGGVPDHGCRAR
jgi:hypothetical protein